MEGSRLLQFRAVRFQRSDHRPHRRRPACAWRSAQQRGHEPARGRRRPGRDGDRERPPVQPASGQGQRDRDRPPVQFERRRVAHRRARGRRSRGSCAHVEPPRRVARRRGPRAGGRSADLVALPPLVLRHPRRDTPRSSARHDAVPRPVVARSRRSARVAGEPGDRAAPATRPSGGRLDSGHRRRHRSREPGRAVAAVREDGGDRIARRRRRARGEYASHRNLEFHAAPARAIGGRGSAARAAREDRAADVPGSQDRQ